MDIPDQSIQPKLHLNPFYTLWMLAPDVFFSKP